jgi:hypothetical protein
MSDNQKIIYSWLPAQICNINQYALLTFIFLENCHFNIRDEAKYVMSDTIPMEQSEGKILNIIIINKQIQ